MGQYYKPVSLDKQEHLDAHSYDNGLKLMEHSWLGNNFVGAVEALLMKGGAWHKNRIVWAGDYADPEVKSVDIFTSIYYFFVSIFMTLENFKKFKENKVDGDQPNLYSMCDAVIHPEATEVPEEYKYLVNHTKKVVVDKTKVPFDKGTWHDGTLQIHPLPILTCEGNGRGGGDLQLEELSIGSWSRDSISIEKEIPKRYKEVAFNITEA